MSVYTRNICLSVILNIVQTRVVAWPTFPHVCVVPVHFCVPRIWTVIHLVFWKLFSTSNANMLFHFRHSHRLSIIAPLIRTSMGTENRTQTERFGSSRATITPCPRCICTLSRGHIDLSFKFCPGQSPGKWQNPHYRSEPKSLFNVAQTTLSLVEKTVRTLATKVLFSRRSVGLR